MNLPLRRSISGHHSGRRIAATKLGGDDLSQFAEVDLQELRKRWKITNVGDGPSRAPLRDSLTRDADFLDDRGCFVRPKQLRQTRHGTIHG